MTLTIHRRDYPAEPICQFVEVLDIRSDGQYLRVTQYVITDGPKVVMIWPLPLASIAELTLTEP